ncbi:hypothetical protein JTB14_024363 [Gonioctena quinquepunctata]|nr:hypothetical protein JTB14_024363 [Gonioctena quinquepunctata]
MGQNVSSCCRCSSNNGKHAKGCVDSSTSGSKDGGAPIAPDRRRHLRVTNNTIQLVLDEVKKEDAGLYTITARSSSGTASREVELRVGATVDIEEPPAFLRRLNDLSVKVGTRTRFLVEIRSNSELTIEWYRNEGRVTEEDRYTFVNEGGFHCVDVAPVTADDSGRWTCTARNALGQASSSCHLNVLVPKTYKPPEFLEDLRALLTEQGTVSLECKVVGVPTPTLRWFKDGKEIRAGDVFALTANADDPTSLGTYVCEAVNCMGKVVSSSKVHVMGSGTTERSADSHVPTGPPPIFKRDLQDESIKIGDPILLTCQVSVPPWPKSIHWYNSEGRIDDDQGSRYKQMADGIGGYMLEVKPTEAITKMNGNVNDDGVVSTRL